MLLARKSVEKIQANKMIMGDAKARCFQARVVSQNMDKSSRAWNGTNKNPKRFRIRRPNSSGMRRDSCHIKKAGNLVKRTQMYRKIDLCFSLASLCCPYGLFIILSLMSCYFLGLWLAIALLICSRKSTYMSLICSLVASSRGSGLATMHWVWYNVRRSWS